MISVTDNAKAELKRLLLLCTDHGETGIRLVLNGSDQFSVILDEQVEGDQVVEYEGTKVLLIGRELFSLVSGATIDLESNGSKLDLVMHWHNPRPSGASPPSK